MSRKKTLTGYHVLAMIVAFFTVIVSVNFTMAWLASDSWTGLVVKNSYVASQKFNGRLEAAKRQSSRGWKMKINYHDSRIGVTINDREGKPVILPKLAIKIGRPVSEIDDLEMVLNHQGEGIYGSPMKLAEGIWAFELNADGDVTYHIEGRMLVSASGVGTMQ